MKIEITRLRQPKFQFSIFTFHLSNLSSSSRVDLQCLLEALHSLLQILDTDTIGDTGLMAATLGVDIETRGGSQHHRGTLVRKVGKQPLAELIAIPSGQRYFREVAESVSYDHAEQRGNQKNFPDGKALGTKIAHGQKQIKKCGCLVWEPERSAIPL